MINEKRYDELFNKLNNKFKILLKKDILGKSNISLLNHTINVAKESILLLEKNKYTSTKLKTILKIDDNNVITDLLAYAIFFHDLGKSVAQWQEHCKNKNLQNVKMRHEFASIFWILEYLKDEKKTNLEISIILASVFAHHSNLGTCKVVKEKINITYVHLPDGHKEKLERYTLYEYVTRIFANVTDKLKTCDKILLWYKQAFLRYYLQLADKRASAKEYDSKITLPSFQNFKLKENHNLILRPLQEDILKRASEDILVMRAPTGSGKSLAAIKWAYDQIDNGKADRLVVAMPTKFTSNILALSFGEYVENIGVSHGNSRSLYDTYEDYKWGRTLQKSVTVCTIDHLLNAMSLSTEEQQHILFNLTNCAVVIDEADFYDAFIQANVFKLIKYLQNFNVPILIMSATLPDRFIELLEKHNKIGTKILEDKSDYDRIRTQIVNIIETEYLYNEYLKKVVDHKNAIVYCNTVDRALYAYAVIKKELEESKLDKKVILYHSMFIEEDKIKIEKEIISLLGKNSVERTGIIIMTQIGELSIDISSDYILTDICPMDRLVQRFGRGCRFSTTEICNVDIVIPTKDNKIYPAPYGNFVRLYWVENEYMKKTRELIKVGKYNYVKYIKIVNDIYKEYDFDKNAIENANKLERLNMENIFFNSITEIEEGNANANWNAREIDVRIKVYVGEPPAKCDTKNEWAYKYNNNSVQIAVYNIKKHAYKLENKTVIIEDGREEKVIYLLEDFYNNEYGADLNEIVNKKLSIYNNKNLPVDRQLFI